MKKNVELTEASRQYAAAYAEHYTGRNMPLAFQLYKELMASYPNSQEANYARMQVQNLINAVVSKQELLDAQIELLLIHFENQSLQSASK